MTRRLNLFLLVLLLMVGLPTYWLLIDNRPGDAEAKPISMVELRRHASSIPGKAPAAIRYELIGKFLRMRNLTGAGMGLRSGRLFAISHMLEIPGEPPILIGTGITRDEANALSFSTYDSKAQARVNLALRKAGHIIPLGNRTSQLGGARAMAADTSGALDLSSIETLDKTDADGRPHALAPGVVVIPMPGLKPGTRLVFVRLGDGREYLFAGNLARIRQAWTELRAPARLITDHVDKENRQEVYSWLLTLRKLKRQAPDLVIVSGNKIPRDGGLERYFPGHETK